MPETARQLAFDLPLDPSFGREDFLVSPSNERAYSAIERWPDWPDPILHLRGPRGSGKSHLASIWATAAHGWTIDAFEVTAHRVPHLASVKALVIDDIDRGSLDEAALFHLVNLVRECGGSLLMTASSSPENWGLRVPDLLSRLRLAPSVSIDAPDDALLKAVLVKLFVDRQLIVDTSVVDYLATHIERSLGEAAEVVAALDQEALSRGRRVTRALAVDIIGRRASAGERSFTEES